MKSLGVLMWTEGLNASNVCVLKCERICVDGALVWGYWQVKRFMQVEIHLMKLKPRPLLTTQQFKTK